MVAKSAKKKTDAKFKSAKKNLSELTKGANDRLKSHYGTKYRMNTKKAGKAVGVSKKK